MEDFATLAIFSTFFGFALLDLVRPARDYPRVPWWRLKGLVAFGVYVGLATAAPLVWDAWLADHRLIDATGLPLAAQAAIAFGVLELGIYGWHRALHGSSWLWRWFHQMHHSAERVDVFGAFYFHPFDTLGWTAVGSLTLVWVLGLSPEAAITANLLATFFAVFQHSNLRTPRWLGWFLMRPESHALHHARGVHAFNYADIPLLDVIFGTYRNPEHVEPTAGFYDGASSRLGAMLLGRDVSEPPPAEGEDHGVESSLERAA